MEGDGVSIGSPALDAAALELLEALESLQQRRHLLSQLLREGWLSLSQARYSLGCHRVSSLQYGATIVPRVRVLPRAAAAPGSPRKRGCAPPPGPPDPLSWFGVLVPPSLRQAQSSFIQGVTVAVELAGLQGEVAAAVTRYRTLLRRHRHPHGDTQTAGTPGDTESRGDTEGTDAEGATETPGAAVTSGATGTG
ncbi:vacuolar ATPase assembly protein VMA22 isoform X4 [Athene noctua]|uniref:vacuolar ATPase assembly protein VMA22 isoform X4 n=1 Tax=Athene noctua TaxID=126797 RepID=UPI003EBA2078